MGLFSQADFVSSSGIAMKWKIECDALDDSDIECLAALAVELLKHMGRPHQNIVGVPRGGLKLAEEMQKLVGERVGPIVVVDDVLTTGRNVDEAMASNGADCALVIFARRPCPDRVFSLFQANWFLDLPSVSPSDEKRTDGW